MSKCDWLRGHKYDQWKVVEQSKLIRGNDETAVIGTSLLQSRKCEECGYVELKIQNVRISD